MMAARHATPTPPKISRGDKARGTGALLLLLEPANTSTQSAAARLLSLPANSLLPQTLKAYRHWWLHYN